MIQETLNQIQSDPGKFIAIALWLYEIFVRLRPTKRNLSILAILTKVINLVLPNRKIPTDFKDTENKFNH